MDNFWCIQLANFGAFYIYRKWCPFNFQIFSIFGWNLTGQGFVFECGSTSPVDIFFYKISLTLYCEGKNQHSQILPQTSILGVWIIVRLTLKGARILLFPVPSLQLHRKLLIQILLLWKTFIPESRS